VSQSRIGSAEVAEDLASQALDNLVNQFARPLDFLRELVQNAIDAGTPRVEVWFRFQEPSQAGRAGVLEIHVDDFGDGMDESIIDGQLTRMFASNKEDDLTKIGKFGIGFTSIFAIRPDAVLLRTGRHDERWELLFHPDRSFDKIRIDEPVYGTQITLFKTMARHDVESFVARCRWTLGYWLEHSDIPVMFAGPALHGAGPAPAATSADPFAAFAGPATAAIVDGHLPFEQLNSELHMDAELQTRVETTDLQGFVAYSDTPVHAFYNGGLTLIRSTSGDALGRHAATLGHFAFKLKGRHLEHTLTRDNVLQDEAWRSAMLQVLTAAVELRPMLLTRIREETHPGGDPDPWLRLLATDCLRARAHHLRRSFASELVLPMANGEPATFADVQAQDRRLGHVLVSGAHSGLDRALIDDGLVVLADRPAVRAILRATWDPSLLGLALLKGLQPLGVRTLPFVRTEQPLVSTDRVFALPELLNDGALPNAERAMLEAARSLLSDVGSPLTLRIGEFGGLGVERELALEGPPEGGVFHREPQDGWALTSSRSRCLLLNRHHEVWRAQATVAARLPLVAAFGLLVAVLHGEQTEDLLGELLESAMERAR